MARPGVGAAAAAVLVAAGIGGGALAAGGGGGPMGGGGGMPSFSGPTFDPVQEYKLGEDAFSAGKFKEAVRHFTSVSSAAPQNADVWYSLGMAKAGAGDLKGAQKAYEKSVKLAPDNIAAHQELGVILAKLNEADKAKAELEVLKQKAAACGDRCSNASALKSAVAAVEGALGPAPSAALTPPSLLFMSPKEGDQAYVQAVSLINQHRYDDALRSLDAAARTFGPHPDVLTYQGYTWRKLGQLDRAEGYYRQALAISPHHRGANEYYGELKVERGDLKGARRLLAELDRQCAFGCIEAETLRQWIAKGHDPAL